MTHDAQPVDITQLPELSRLVDEVQQTHRPCVLRRGNQNVAMIVSLAPAVITPVPYNPALEALLASLPKDSVVARTAGALHTDQPFPGYEEEDELAAAAFAAETVASWEE